MDNTSFKLFFETTPGKFYFETMKIAIVALCLVVVAMTTAQEQPEHGIAQLEPAVPVAVQQDVLLQAGNGGRDILPLR